MSHSANALGRGGGNMFNGCMVKIDGGAWPNRIVSFCVMVGRIRLRYVVGFYGAPFLGSGDSTRIFIVPL